MTRHEHVCGQCGKKFGGRDEREAERAFDRHPCVTRAARLSIGELLGAVRAKGKAETTP